MKRLVFLLALLVAAPALAETITPGQPVISYPTADLTNVQLYPTIWWGPYTQATSDAGSSASMNVVPIDGQVEIAAEGAGVADHCDDTGEGFDDFTDSARRYTSYITDTAPSAKDCVANNDCIGAGMAHLACAAVSWTGDEDTYCGGFWNGTSNDPTIPSLAENIGYCVRVRWGVRLTDITSTADAGAGTYTCGGTTVGGVCYGTWSEPVRFITVDYANSPNRYASTTGSGSACTIGSPCSLETAVEGASAGDYIQVNQGTYTLTANQLDPTADRLKIVGSGSPEIIFNVAGNDQGVADWRDRADFYVDGLTFKGYPSGCYTTCAGGTNIGANCNSNAACPGSYCQPLGNPTDGNFLDLQDSGDGDAVGSSNMTFVNTTFSDCFALFTNISNPGAGSPNLTLVNVTMNNMPKNGWPTSFIDTQATWGSSRFYTGISPAYNTFMTWHSVDIIGGGNINMYSINDFLLDDVLIENITNHPWRPQSTNERWTARRFIITKAQEGWQATHASSGMKDVVIENSTFDRAFGISNNAGAAQGTIDYLVLKNNIWVGGSPQFDMSDFVDVVACPQSPADCDLFDFVGTTDATADRVLVDYNDVWRVGGNWGLKWDGTTYGRCGSPGYTTLMATAQWGANNIANNGCGGELDDFLDPQMTTRPADYPGASYDFTPKITSPILDKGDPDYRTPSIGDFAVDLGAVERPKQQWELEIQLTVDSNASGTLTTSPAGISSNTTSSYPHLRAYFDNGSTVTLGTSLGVGVTASFGGVNGNPDCADGSITMDTNKMCVVRFTKAPTQLFTLTIDGAGTGDVTSVPSGIACPGDCSNGYYPGQIVTLTAVPSGGSTFAGWSGDCSGTVNPLSFVAPDFTDCTATFTP